MHSSSWSDRELLARRAGKGGGNAAQGVGVSDVSLRGFRRELSWKSPRAEANRLLEALLEGNVPLRGTRSRGLRCGDSGFLLPSCWRFLKKGRMARRAPLRVAEPGWARRC